MAAKNGKKAETPWYAWVIMLVAGLLAIGAAIWAVMSLTGASAEEKAAAEDSSGGLWGWVEEGLFKGEDDSSIKDKIQSWFS